MLVIGVEDDVGRKNWKEKKNSVMDNESNLIIVAEVYQNGRNCRSTKPATTTKSYWQRNTHTSTAYAQ